MTLDDFVRVYRKKAKITSRQCSRCAKLRSQVLARARVVGEIFGRMRDARRRRVLDATLSTWCSTRQEEKRMAIRVQSVVRGRRDRYGRMH